MMIKVVVTVWRLLRRELVRRAGAQSVGKVWFGRGSNVAYNGGKQERAMDGMNLFGTIPEDFLQFGRGEQFDAKRVPQLLGLKKEDVSRVAQVSVKSVRYDENIPERVRERLEEIGNTINMVAQAFNGDVPKTVAWFKARNPLLGDISPRDMIRLGRYERLRRYIINAMTDRTAEPVA